MNNIRYMVKVKSIDLEKLFNKIGSSSKMTLGYSSFKELMMNIDDELTDEEIKYTFKKINESGSGSISHAEFQKAVLKFHIPMSKIQNNTDKG